MQDHYDVLGLFSQTRSEVSDVNRSIEQQKTKFENLEQLQKDYHQEMVDLTAQNRSNIRGIKHTIESEAARTEKIEQTVTDIASLITSTLSNYQACNINDLMLNMVQLQPELRKIQQNQEWQSNVQSVPPLEIATYLHQKSSKQSNSHIRKGWSDDNLPRTPSCEPLTHRSSLDIETQEYLLHDHAKHVSVQNKTLRHPVLRHETPFLSTPLRLRQERISKWDRRLYVLRLESFIGYLEINAYQNYVETVAGKFRDFIDVEINILLRPAICRSFVRANITYDRVHGPSSPIHMELQFPNIRSYDSDPIVDLLRDGSFSDFESLFQLKGYKPNDQFLSVVNQKGIPLFYSRSICDCSFLNVRRFPKQQSDNRVTNTAV